MRRPIEVRRVSVLGTPRGEVWATISTMSGVNAELWPFVQMTWPREHRALTADVPTGRVLFDSWLLLFGVIPFDRHHLRLEGVEDGEAFVEESTSLLQRRWRHERTLCDLRAGGCVVEDSLVIEPRFRMAGPILAVIVTWLFRHRHSRLRRRFGDGPTHL